MTMTETPLAGGLGASGFVALLDTQQAVALAGGEVDAVMKAVVEGALRVMPHADGAVIEMRDGDEMVYRAASGTSAGSEGLRLRLATSLSGLCVLKGEPLTCEDSEEDPRVDREACRRVGLRSMIVVPLPHRGVTVGAFKLYAAQPRAFSAEDMLAAQLLAGPIAIGLSGIAEAQAELARDRAMATAEAKSSFLANMSHEIRTPMNGIIGFGDLLLRTELTPEQHRYATMIVESGGALLKLLNDILDFSKIEAGQLEVVREPFDLLRTLEHCAQLLKPGAEAKGLALIADFDPLLPQHIVGDGLRLRQVVLNLLGNAVKFTPTGSISLKARVARRRGQPDALLISVSDTGIGIPPDKVDVIFEKFTQADASVSRRFGGSGLGLSISQRLAELMGGELELESAVGRGTTVMLRLPLKEAAAPVRRPEPAAATAVRPAYVLLVEDVDLNRELAIGMLEALGHSVEVAVDGTEAIRRFAEQGHNRPFDVVLMDVNMPGMDGLEATRAIRALGARGAAVPIVALTASALPEEVSRCLASGMNDHLAKPITQDLLAAKLARWLPDATPRPPAAPQPAAEPILDPKMAALAEKFAARKRDTLAALRLIWPSSEDDALLQVRDISHKLAGIAGVFGEPELGELARRVDDITRETPLDQPALAYAVDRLISALEG